MVSHDEYFKLKKSKECESDPFAYLDTTCEERREHIRLYGDLPSEEYELPLTRVQALVLVAAYYCRAERLRPVGAVRIRR
jgi:hypothetical protein